MDTLLSAVLPVFYGGLGNLAAYLAAHVLLCLLPAFFIGGAMSALIPKETITRFLGRNSSKTVSYPAAAAAGSLLAVCSCTKIELLRTRYPGVRVGYSTHESPDNTLAVGLALAKGASVFEKHVVLPTEKYAANAYSATPEQIRAWLGACRRARAICGSSERYQPSAGERASLQSLRRGVFATRDIPAGSELDTGMVEFAFPPVDGQVTANDWSKYARFVATTAIAAGQPVRHTEIRETQLRSQVLEIVTAVKALLKAGNVVVPGKSDLEISHHYGLERFREFGLTMVTVVNREYCKKRRIF